MTERSINSLLGQNLRRKFQPCWHEDKNDENEKKKRFSSRNWKWRQLPLSYTNKNARHRLFCSFTHPTSIDLAKVWIRPSSSQPPPPPTTSGQAAPQPLNPLPSLQVHVDVNGKSQAALAPARALPEVTELNWGENWVFSVSLDGGWGQDGSCVGGWEGRGEKTEGEGILMSLYA